MCSLPDVPVIPDRWDVVEVSAHEVRLVSATGSLALKSPAPGLLSQLLQALRSGRSVQHILRELGSFDAEQVQSALIRLHQIGALEQVSDSHAEQRFQEQITWFSNFIAPGLDANRSRGIAFQQRLQQASVLVVELGVCGSLLTRNLALTGIGKLTGADAGTVTLSDVESAAWFGLPDLDAERTVAVGNAVRNLNTGTEFQGVRIGDSTNWVDLMRNQDLVVVVPDRDNPNLLERVNAAALETGTRWIPWRMTPFEVHIGPTIIPWETACYTCLDLRVKSNLAAPGEHELMKQHLRNGGTGLTHWSQPVGLDLLTLEVVKSLTTFVPPATQNHAYVQNLLSLESALHPVLKLPRCPSCGAPARNLPGTHPWQQLGEPE